MFNYHSEHHSYLTSQFASLLLTTGEKPHSHALPHLGTSSESSSAPRTHVTLQLLGMIETMPQAKLSAGCGRLLLNPDRHLLDSCAGLSWQAGRRGQPGKETF